jgi:hypothetical protein
VAEDFEMAPVAAAASGGASAQTLPDYLVTPADPRLLVVSTVVLGNGTMFGVRVRCRKAGTLNNFCAAIGASSGNVKGFVFDTGDASTGVRTKLWDSGSVATGTANNWQNIASPGLTVTLGQELDLAAMFDNGTASLGKASITSANYATLPTGIWTTPGAVTPRLVWAASGLTFATPPASFADGSLTTMTHVPALMATVT